MLDNNCDYVVVHFKKNNCVLSDDVYACKKHLSLLSTKKNICLMCNKKCNRKDKLFLCENCLSSSIDNFKEMETICNFPLVSRSECGCKYCV